jgi:uncharacterized protein YqgQ
LKDDIENIIIVEDDFCLEISEKEAIDILNKILKQDFNIMSLSYHNPVIQPIELYDNNLSFMKNCQTATFYIVKRSFAPILIQNYKDTIIQRLKNPENSDLINDQSWKKLQTIENKFYCSIPRIGRQIPSWSDIEYKNVDYGGSCFMGILSCEKYKNRRESQDLSKCPFVYRYFIGNADIKEPTEDYQNKIVYLPCSDDYGSLPQKVMMMNKWILKNYPFIDYLFKTDDDIRFNFINLFENFKQVILNKYDYAGYKADVSDHVSGYFKEKDPSNPLVFVPATKYCAGGGYFLSKKCVSIVSQMETFSTVYEDQSIGYILNQNNIYPNHINIHNHSCFF